MNVAIVCIALLGVLLIGLGFSVSIMRGRAETLYGFDPDPENSLYKLIRAHGNTAEFAPMLAVLIFVAGSFSPATWVLWVMGIVTLARYVIVAGILAGKSLNEANPLRFVGALFTYLGGFALCIAVLIGA
jgi:uncharacterized membrane protein YecN with MAPEG domain